MYYVLELGTRSQPAFFGRLLLRDKFSVKFMDLCSM